MIGTEPAIAAPQAQQANSCAYMVLKCNPLSPVQKKFRYSPGHVPSFHLWFYIFPRTFLAKQVAGLDVFSGFDELRVFKYPADYLSKFCSISIVSNEKIFRTV